jgi:hypothetical protein
MMCRFCKRYTEYCREDRRAMLAQFGVQVHYRPGTQSIVDYGQTVVNVQSLGT